MGAYSALAGFKGAKKRGGEEGREKRAREGRRRGAERGAEVSPQT